MERPAGIWQVPNETAILENTEAKTLPFSQDSLSHGKWVAWEL